MRFNSLNFIQDFSVIDFCENKRRNRNFIKFWISTFSYLHKSTPSHILKMKACLSFFTFLKYKSKEKVGFLRERKDGKKKKKGNLQGMPVLPLSFFPLQFVANGTAGQNCEL